MIVERLMVIVSLTAVDWAERMIERTLMWVGWSAGAPGPTPGKGGGIPPASDPKTALMATRRSESDTRARAS